MKGSGQLAFRLPFETARGVEDFFVTKSNEAAAAAIGRWPSWDFPSLLLVGPRGAGKTHLLRVWEAKSGAARIEAGSLSEDAVEVLSARKALAVEDVDRGVGDERVLFHVLNAAREQGCHVLLTSRVAAGELAARLPDLRSRLRALPAAILEPPDDILIKAALVKLFADRQMAVQANVVSYIALNVERSMAEVISIVALLDEMSLTLQRKVTAPLAAEALARRRTVGA